MSRFVTVGSVRKQLLAAAVAVPLALTAACASSGTSTGTPPGATSPTAVSQSSSAGDAGATADAAAVDAQIAKYAALRTDFPQPGPALTQAQTTAVKNALSGKTVWFIPIFRQAIQFGSEIKSFTAAMHTVGASVHVCDAQVNPSTATQCLLQAVSSHAAGIVTSAIDYAFATQGLKAAIAAKIPLVLADDDETGSSALPSSPVARQLSVGGSYFGRLGADWIIADSNGKANVLYAADDASSGVIQAAATENEYQTKCPGCTVTTVHYSDGSLTKLATAVSSALIAHPDITYVQGAYDEPSGIYTVQGIRQVAGRHLKFVAGGGSPVGLQRIHLGQESASPGVDTSAIAWDMADSIFRFAAGVPQVKTYPLTLRLFTSSNLPSNPTDTGAFESGAWYSNGGFRAMYQKLWGVAG